MNTKFEYELVMCVVNAGFADSVMTAAREAGAKGGTIIHAGGTANNEAEKFFKITVEPNKDMVMILVPSSIRDAVMKNLYAAIGLTTPGSGIAFALPVTNVIGLKEY